MTTSRNKVVLWIGSEPDPSLKHEFTVRGHEFKHLQYEEFAPGDQNVIKSICQAKGVLFLHDEEKPSRTFDFISCFSNLPVSYSGVRPYVFVNDPNSIPAILGNLGVIAISTRQTIPFFDTSASPDYSTFAQTLASHDSGRSPKLDLNIDDENELLEETHKVLLKRSFSDCESIVVRKMSQGRSATVVTVYPTYQYPPLCGHPLPYIAKFDNCCKITKEISYYNDYVIRHIPFNLRPGIDISRCINDCNIGVIVANLADRTISLLEAIKRGAGPQALHSLFEEALENWFHNAKPEFTHPYLSLQPINFNSTDEKSTERNRFRMRKFQSEVFKQASKYDSVLEPFDLLERIQNIPCNSYLSGITHRDLHTKNVLVKGSDAIVIDYAKTNEGPVLLDMATLDVSIAFDAAPIQPKADIYKEEIQEKLNLEFEKECDAWETFVSDIFDKENVLGLPLQKNGHDPCARDWACIRQVRRLALSAQISDNEYAICVAIELLRCSTLTSKATRIRAYAYYLADRLAKSLGTPPQIKTTE